MIVYLAGKYSGDTEKNIQDARKIAAELWDLGYTVICPHTNTAFFERMCKHVTYEQWLTRYIHIMYLCDAVVLLPGWEQSMGAKIEKMYAEKAGMQISEYPSLPFYLNRNDNLLGEKENENSRFF